MELNEAMELLVEHGRALVQQMHDYYMENEDAYLGDAIEHAKLGPIDKASVLLATNEIGVAFGADSEGIDYCIYMNATVR